MTTIQELQNLRTTLIYEINDKIERMIATLRTNSPETETTNERTSPNRYECTYPLTTPTSVFKGKRPIRVIFPNGRQEMTPTWKKVFEVIMKQCNSHRAYHSALMSLRGNVMGRNRLLLDKAQGEMRSPVQIDQELFAETHYDTETLLRILTERILSAIEYDYSGIQIVIKSE